MGAVCTMLGLLALDQSVESVTGVGIATTHLLSAHHVTKLSNVPPELENIRSIIREYLGTSPRKLTPKTSVRFSLLDSEQNCQFCLLVICMFIQASLSPRWLIQAFFPFYPPTPSLQVDSKLQFGKASSSSHC